LPPPTIVTVTGVHLALGWASLADPTAAEAWLVPVYVFELDGGGSVPILAVADGYLTTASTSVPSTLVVPTIVSTTLEPGGVVSTTLEPGGVGSTTSEPGGVVSTTSEPGGVVSTTSEPGVVSTTVGPP